MSYGSLFTFTNTEDGARSIGKQWGLEGEALDKFVRQIKNISVQLDVFKDGSVKILAVYFKSEDVKFGPVLDREVVS